MLAETEGILPCRHLTTLMRHAGLHLRCPRLAPCWPGVQLGCRRWLLPTHC